VTSSESRHLHTVRHVDFHPVLPPARRHSEVEAWAFAFEDMVKVNLTPGRLTEVLPVTQPEGVDSSALILSKISSLCTATLFGAAIPIWSGPQLDRT